MSQRLARLLVASVLLAGCADTVDEVGFCEPVGEARAVANWAGRSFPMALGTVDGHTLFVWGRALDATETSDVVYSAQWFDRDFMPEGDVLELGTGRPAHRSRLIAHDHSLSGQFYIDPSGDIPPLQAADAAGIWRFSPGHDAEPMLVELPVSHDRYRPDWDPPAPSLSYAELSAGAQGELPVV